MKKPSRAGGKVPKVRHGKSFKLKRHIVPKPTAARSSAMQQIADWLEKIGLSEYTQRFADNRIDFTVLRDLTDQDLKDLGVVLGDRRRMLRAIAEFGGAVPAPPPPTLTEPKAQDSAERRQITVLFSDLVGSTALSARIDPEDLREIISAYQRCVSETVGRLGGFVAKYMGDGVLFWLSAGARGRCRAGGPSSRARRSSVISASKSASWLERNCATALRARS
jgi:class 3 adenylate cyclase